MLTTIPRKKRWARRVARCVLPISRRFSLAEKRTEIKTKKEKQTMTISHEEVESATEFGSFPLCWANDVY